MKTIPLTQGKFAIVDDADFAELSKYRWYVKKEPHTSYAAADVGGRKNRKRLRMHRLIMNAMKGFDVDHINHNGLDNRRCNLRICTRRQNIRNTLKRFGSISTSKYKGVHWRKDSSRWQARIFNGSRQVSLGHFDTEVDAAKAYNKAASEYFGEFAKLNNIESEVA